MARARLPSFYLQSGILCELAIGVCVLVQCCQQLCVCDLSLGICHLLVAFLSVMSTLKEYVAAKLPAEEAAMVDRVIEILQNNEITQKGHLIEAEYADIVFKADVPGLTNISL